MYPQQVHQHRPPALYGPIQDVNWHAFIARSAVRSLVLWPLLRFVGGVSGPRAVATAAAAGAALTGVELAFDASGLLMRPSSDPVPEPISSRPVESRDPAWSGFIDVNGEPIP